MPQFKSTKKTPDEPTHEFNIAGKSPADALRSGLNADYHTEVETPEKITGDNQFAIIEDTPEKATAIASDGTYEVAPT